MKPLLTTVFALFLVGCVTRAMEDQIVDLKPSVTIAQPANAGRKQVAVEVVDDRDQTIIGHRYFQYGDAAKITAKQDLTKLIRGHVAAALEKHGFRPTNRASRSLVLELRQFRYYGSQKLDFGLHMNVILKAIAQNAGRTFKRTYRVEKEIRVMIVADAPTNAKLINDALSEAINKIANDADLIGFLAK